MDLMRKKLSKLDKLEILHKPYGIYDPYYQLPYERFPREPIEKEEVKIGAVTKPELDSAIVKVKWSVNGKDCKNKRMNFLSENNSCKEWIVSLGSFNKGDEVSYELILETLKERVSTEKFIFKVLGWSYYNEVVESRIEDNNLFLKIISKVNPKDHLNLLLKYVKKNVVRIKLSKNDFKNKEPFKDVVSNHFHKYKDTIFREIELKKKPFKLRFINKKVKIELDIKNFRILDDNKKNIRKIGMDVSIGEDKLFTGLGERFDQLYKRNKKLDICVYEQYKKQGEKTYIPIPFIVSTKGYGLFLNIPYRSYFDIGESNPNFLKVESETSGDNSIYLDFFLFFPGNIKKVIKLYTYITGKPTLPPKWVFGPWISSNRWNSQKIVIEQIKKTLELKIPATVVVVEAWSDESTFYIFNDADYIPKPGNEIFNYSDFTFPENGKWPDPKSLIDFIHSNDMKVLLWQIPVEKYLNKPHPQKDADESYMIEKGFCAKESDGNPYRIPGRWFNNGLLIDFTNKEAGDWWLSKRRYLLEDLDIDGFKIDGGEHLWKKGVIFSNGKNIDVMRNLYPIKYQEAYYNLIEEDKTKERILYSRSGYFGSQKFTCHWAGDEDSTFEAFRASIRAGLSAGLSGISFWGFDLAGFSGDIPTPELFLRSTAVATFCPIMQYHSENTGKLPGCKDRTPWNIEEITCDKRVINVFRKFANLRMNLIPYIYNEAIYSSKTGLPLMRPLILDFPKDKRCFKYIYQYLFGRSILVAPIVWENINVMDIYLPKGKWIDFWNGKEYIGPKILEYKVPIDIVPLFVRENNIVPIDMDSNFSLCKNMGNSVDFVSNLVFFFSPSTNRVKLLNEEDGLSLTYINYKKIDDEIVLQVKSKSGSCNLGIWCEKPSKVIVNDIVYEQGLDNRKAKLANKQWIYDKNMKVVFFKFLNKIDELK